MWKKCCIAVGIIIVVSVIYARYTAHIYIEGMTTGNPQEFEKAIQRESIQLRDEINLRDYRKNYEEIILETETWAQRKRIQLLTQKFTRDPTIITQFNNLSTFITNLNDTLTWADKN